MTIEHVNPPENIELVNSSFSRKYKWQLFKAIFAISLFIFVYIVLIAFAGVITAGVIYLGKVFIDNLEIFPVSIIFIFFMLLGIFLVWFILRSLFVKSKFSFENSIELTRIEQPKLFELIDEIADEVGTEKPNKIYLDGQLNAGVFFNSSFWALLFPVKKNMSIGAPLLLSHNYNEFKSIIAHELGHFSQKSLRVSSYVFLANTIISKMIEEPTFIEKALAKRKYQGGKFPEYLSNILEAMTDGIKGILRFVYKVVNIQYLSLSREMEFHADQIAARIAGSKATASALQRSEFFNSVYNATLEDIGTLYEQGYKCSNLLEAYRLNQFRVAKINEIPVVNGILNTDHLVERYKSFRVRIFIHDPWASHPEIQDGLKNIFNFPCEVLESDVLPISLLENGNSILEKISNKTYPADLKEGLSIISPQQTIEWIDAYNIVNRRPQVFNGFFDNRVLGDHARHSGENSEGQLQAPASSWEAFDPEQFNNLAIQERLSIEIQILNQIENKQIKVEWFEFKREKYPSKRAGNLKKDLEMESQQIEEKIKTIDLKAFSYLKNLSDKYCTQPQNSWENLCNEQFTIQDEFNKLIDSFSLLLKLDHSIQTKKQWFHQELCDLDKSILEIDHTFHAFLNRDFFNGFISFVRPGEFTENLTKFKSNPVNNYLSNDKLHHESYDFLGITINRTIYEFRRYIQLKFKEKLEIAEEWIKKESANE